MADYIEGARVYHSAAQNVPEESYMILAFDSERWDTDNIHDPVTNNSRLTCRTAGKYVVAAQAHFEQGGICMRVIAIRLNGTLLVGPSESGITTGSQILIAWDRNPDGPTRMNCMTILNLAVGDYVELLVHNGDYLEAGGWDILAEACTTPEFMMQRIGPPGIETFSAALSGLKPNTTYHFRAKATNAAGTSYGDDRTFTTPLAPLGSEGKAYALAREEL